MTNFICLLLNLFPFASSSSEGPFLQMFPDKNQIPESDQLMIKIMDSAVNEVEKKYGLYGIGFGMRGKNKFEGISLEFQMDRQVTKDEARAILLDCANIFSEKINKNELIKPHLMEYPIDNKNVGITFYIEDENQTKVFHPNICVACWSRKGVYFRTNDPDVEYGYKETAEETHEEALELVKHYRASQVAQSEFPSRP